MRQRERERKKTQGESQRGSATLDGIQKLLEHQSNLVDSQSEAACLAFVKRENDQRLKISAAAQLYTWRLFTIRRSVPVYVLALLINPQRRRAVFSPKKHLLRSDT